MPDLTPSAVVTPDINAPSPQVSPVPPPGMIAPQNAQQQSPVNPTAVPQQPTPQQQQLAHSALIGHGFKSLVSSMAGSSTQYQMTPNGPQPVEVPNKPGQFFRNILAGAIMGGVAGGSVSGSETAGSGWMGAAKGAGAAQQGFQQQQQQRQQEAQKQFENQQAATKENREQTLMNATIAQYQSEMAARQHMTDLEDKKYHDAHNAASAALYDTLKTAGGVAPIDGKLPEDLTAYDLAKAYTKDPTIRQAPAGYVRHFIDKTDSDEVTWNGQHWTHPDGSPADMTDKTSIQVLDTPVNAMTTRIKGLSNDTVNKVIGQPILPSGGTTDSVTPLDLVNMAGTRLNREKEIAQTKHEGMMANAQAKQAANEAERLRRDGYAAAKEQVDIANRSLEDQLKNVMPGEEKPITDQISANNDRLRSLYEQTFPDQKLPEAKETPKGDTVTVTTSDGKVGVIPKDKLDDFLKANPGATSPGHPTSPTPPATLKSIVKGAQQKAEDYLKRMETFYGIGGSAPAQGAP